MICLQELSQSSHRFLQHRRTRKVNNAEVVRFLPVKASAGNHQNSFLTEKIKRKLIVICNVESLHINLREDVERSLRLLYGDTGDIIKQFINQLTLFVNPAARNNIFIHALVPTKRSLDDGLSGNIGAKPHIGKHVHAIDVIPADLLVAAEHHPAHTETADHMRFG